MTISALPVILPCIFVPECIMKIFGSNYAEGAMALTILSIGQFVNVIAGSVGVLLNMSGHKRVWRNIALLTGVLNVILNITLIPIWGITGVAIATATSISFQMLISVVIVWKKLHILTLPLPNFWKK